MEKPVINFTCHNTLFNASGVIGRDLEGWLKFGKERFFVGDPAQDAKLKDAYAEAARLTNTKPEKVKAEK